MRGLRIALLVVIAMALPGAAWADHIPPNVGVIPARLGELPTVFTEGPVRYVSNAQTGRAFSGPLGEVDPFVRDGRRYTIVGSSIYGFSVVDVTDPTAPTVVSEYASAFGCPTEPVENLSQYSGDLLLTGGWENDISFAPDGRWVVLGMDDGGRCHDPIAGGVELVDTSDLTNPHLVHLTRNLGYAHSITLDPLHPWLAYVSTSDGNDVMDIIDFHSCIGQAPAKCKPPVARAVFDPEYLGKGIVDPTTGDDFATSGCHDLRFRGNLAFCAAVGSTLIFDVSGVLDSKDHLTGSDLTQANSCPIVPADPIYAPGATVTDCRGWTKDAFTKAGAKAVNIKLLSAINHTCNAPPATEPQRDCAEAPSEDIQIAHQASAIGDGQIMIITDERGGGLGADSCPGGGVWFYDIRDPRHPVLMMQPDGSKGVFLTKYNLPGIAGANPSCTVHYGREFADENLLTFAWYTNGTRIFRYFPDFSKSPAQIRFEEIAAIAPVGWAFDAMGVTRNPSDPNEVLVYVSDFDRGLDVLAVKTPKLTRAAAFVYATVKKVPKPRVLGTKTTGKPLAGTGVGTATDAASILLFLAFAMRVVIVRLGNRVWAVAGVRSRSSPPADRR